MLMQENSGNIFSLHTFIYQQNLRVSNAGLGCEKTLLSPEQWLKCSHNP